MLHINSNQFNVVVKIKRLTSPREPNM